VSEVPTKIELTPEQALYLYYDIELFSKKVFFLLIEFFHHQLQFFGKFNRQKIFLKHQFWKLLKK